MKYFYFGLVILLSNTLFYAQQFLPVQHDTTAYQQEIIFNSVADYATSALENQFTQKFFYGGYIDSSLKNSSFNRHKGINRLGLDVTGEIEYRHFKGKLLGSDAFGWTIKVGSYNYASAAYPKDVFGLAFYGNEPYLGENINFSGTRFTALSFQKIGWGIIHKKSKSNASLNLYSVSNFADVTIQKGQLFQSTSGDSLSIALNGEFNYSTGNNFSKGLGVGVDLDIRFPVEIIEGKTIYCQFVGKNVGVAFLNDHTQYSANNTFNFSGFTFNQLFGDQTLIIGKNSLLDSLGIHSSTVSTIKLLPGFIQVGKMVDDLNPKRLQAFYGVRMYILAGYSPLIYAGAHYKIAKWLNMGLNVSYGGYTNLRVGLYTDWRLKRWAVGIGSESLEGILSKKALGESFILRLSYKL